MYCRKTEPKQWEQYQEGYKQGQIDRVIGAAQASRVWPVAWRNGYSDGYAGC